MDRRSRVLCPENEGLAAYMLQKRQEIADEPKGISDNLDMTLSKAYHSVCNSKTPIKTLKECSKVKGVGKWILRMIEGYFQTHASEPGTSDRQDTTLETLQNGKKPKGSRRYVPQKNSAAYALLITLHRGTINGKEFMRKQELIVATDASGLSRVPIASEKVKQKPWKIGGSPSSREWYSGWSCMKNLINKGLVVKSHCPAEYMLTEEGHDVARDCLSRSGLVDSIENIAATKQLIGANVNDVSDTELSSTDTEEEVRIPAVALNKKQTINVPVESLERFTRLGYSKEQILKAFTEVSESSPNKDLSSFWPAVLCHLREGQIYGLHMESVRSERLDCVTTSFTPTLTDGGRAAVLDESSREYFKYDAGLHSLKANCSAQILRPCPSSKATSDCLKENLNILSTPPLKFGDRFQDQYEVILILDDREQFTTQGSKSSKLIENIRSQFKIKIEVRRLPVGDGIWIARDKHVGSEYVLDFIVERKRVDDLRSSIRDNRYRDQKLRLLRCGLKKLIYLVEGDPNSLEASDSIKTACFTTEILEGFDVHRTSGLGDTMRKYGYLTQAIYQYYKLELLEEKSESAGTCPPFDDFIKKCQDLDRITVSDVFAIQLMQVPHVTEEVAIAVLNLYPTILSLARAYSLLEGDILAQQDMLRKRTKNMVGAPASKNIFQLVWGS